MKIIIANENSEESVRVGRVTIPPRQEQEITLTRALRVVTHGATAEITIVNCSDCAIECGDERIETGRNATVTIDKTIKIRGMR